MLRGAWTMGDDDKEEGKEEIDSDAEPERLQYKVKSSKRYVLTLRIVFYTPRVADHFVVVPSRLFQRKHCNHIIKQTTQTNDDEDDDDDVDTTLAVYAKTLFWVWIRC